MLFIEISLIASMFITGNQTLGFITIIFGLLSFICAMFGLIGRKSSSNKKLDLLINIPIIFCYCYYIYVLTIWVR